MADLSPDKSLLFTEPDWWATDPEFSAWVRSMPDKYWAKYDLGACRLGWFAARSHVASPDAYYSPTGPKHHLSPPSSTPPLTEWLRDNAPDCGDNSCLFGGRGKGGMRTNGGCRCFKDLPQAKRIYVERLFAAFTPSATRRTHDVLLAITHGYTEWEATGDSGALVKAINEAEVHRQEIEPPQTVNATANVTSDGGGKTNG